MKSGLAVVTPYSILEYVDSAVKEYLVSYVTIDQK